ncbi:cold-shock protein [Halobacteriovorax sp. HLS]|uniref:cold-shock protein n=1 Tax=Halobacteriovorax sp. HLS TaxID=2234000 RepID=UPI000FDA89F9|nr:cold shock domain-containing protein [Halobacteriovorax sp. HLS]
MSEFKVDHVRYDTEKTKKRKRINLLVSAKTEDAVKEKLEKIHKGDKVISISEIKWGEVKQKKSAPKEVLTGRVKFYEEVKGFGFIEPDSDMDDLFFHSTALSGVRLYEGDIVEFEVSEGPKGLIAIRIKLLKN